MFLSVALSLAYCFIYGDVGELMVVVVEVVGILTLELIYGCVMIVCSLINIMPFYVILIAMQVFNLFNLFKNID
jgi:hypothetical protein